MRSGLRNAIPHLVPLAAGCLILAASACIFDEGSYKGGGRLDSAGTASQSESSSSSSSSSGTGDDDDIVLPPILDSGADARDAL